MTNKDQPTAYFVDKEYEPSSSDIDITDLLREQSPEFFTILDSIVGTRKGFRKQDKITLTSQQKRVKKERRKRAKLSRKTNRKN